MLRLFLLYTSFILSCMIFILREIDFRVHLSAGSDFSEEFNILYNKVP